MYKHRKKVNQFNETIKTLLSEQNLTTDGLAAHLGYEADVVRKQLDAEQTFSYDDLLKICSFLHQMPADFFFDRMPSDFAHAAAELKADSRIVRMRFRETRILIVTYFQRRVIYN